METKKALSVRPPIVAVLGHVDHGKTTLLDKIRGTAVQKKEAGGITQNIGASVVKDSDNKDITFIDTPGHAAFSKMRSRGAIACDIALLVVAADDGVKPQSREAINFIKDANVPFIVVCTKVDLPSASPENVKVQVENEGIALEGRGGDVPFVSVSSKTGTGIETLLETIILLFDVQMHNKKLSENLSAIVIETYKSKAGPLVSVVIKTGELKKSDLVFADGHDARIKGLYDSWGVSKDCITAGYPAQILGFSHLPRVGSLIESKIQEIHKDNKSPVQKVDKNAMNFIIKGANSGQLEAILSGLPKGINVLSYGTGEVNEGDITQAKASSAKIINFGLKVKNNILKLAKNDSVIILQFEIIYKLFEAIEELISQSRDVVMGKALIVAVFPFDNKKVAGCKIANGSFSRGDAVSIIRKDQNLGKTKIISMRKQKENINMVKENEECGIILDPQLDFQTGDMIVSVRKAK